LIKPIDVATFPNGEIAIAWEDGHESIFGGHELRCACPCASCVDEMSGVKTLRDETVPQDVRATKIDPVGHYAISVKWSDGHNTGIYSFETLRRICPCEKCRTK
jgi:DUF971 family protein